LGNRNNEAGRILLVEDEPIIRHMCYRVLGGDGFHLDMAESGRVAQQKTQADDYDLILIDLRTPLINGQEFYGYLAEHRPELAEKVVFTTGEMMKEESSFFLEASGIPYLAKPFTPDELRDMVNGRLRQLAA
jgi:DNA-binding response OmpR family regulator